tara:strand:- start:831 stop:1193 length:363 start_codon:yes stop_codon:yes gene_type:complete
VIEMLKGIVGFGCGLALILSSPIVWSEQNVYDIQTIKEVTSVSKINAVCLEDLTKGNLDSVSIEQQGLCSCVSFQLVQTLSFKEYRQIERNIFSGNKHWTDTEAISRVRPRLREACNWTG